MIDVHELRLGNVLECEFDNCILKKGLFELELNVFSFLLHHNQDFIQPVPIESNILFKFGFEDWGVKKINEHETHHEYVLHNILDGTSSFKVCLLHSNYGDEDYYEWIAKVDDDTIYLDYDLANIHRVQNLYYSLTLKELNYECK